MGSSNEISFDVLQGKANTATGTNAPSPWEISPEAVSKKRASRRRSKVIAILVAVLVGLALITGAVLLIAGFIQDQNGSITSLNDGISKVLDLSDQNSELRSDMQIIFTSDADGINNSNVMENYENVLENAESRQQTLNSRLQEFEELQSQIATPTEKEAANNAILLIQSEEALINLAESSKDYVNAYLEKRLWAVEGMNLLVESDSKDREASKYLTNANTDDAQKAIDSANEAKELAAQARERFQQLAAEDSRFEEYATFADLKVQANEATANAAQAYIDRNKEELQSQNDTYNSLQEQASEISASWEKEPSEILDEEFNTARETDAANFADKLKTRDSVYNTVSAYLNKK